MRSTMASSTSTMVGWMNRAVAWCCWSSFRLNHQYHHHYSKQSIRPALALAASSSSARRRRRQQQQQKPFTSPSHSNTAPPSSSWVGPAPAIAVPATRSSKTRSQRRGNGSVMGKKKYYAVAKGRRVGIFDTWEECSSQVRGFKMARYKSFPTRHEAMAFLASFREDSSSSSTTSVIPPVPPPEQPSRAVSSRSSSHDARTGFDAPPYRPPSSLSTRMGTKRPLVAQAPADADAGAVPSWPSVVEMRSNSNPVAAAIPNPYKKKSTDSVPHPSRNENGSGVKARTRLHAAAAQTDGSSAPHREHRRTLTIHINFDGGSRGNPGVAGAGASITVSSNEPWEPPGVASAGDARDGVGCSNDGHRRTIHVRHFLTRKATNNEAEYEGLVAALRIAKQQAQSALHNHSSNAHMKLIVQGDSDLIIKQLKGSYQVKNPKLIPLYRQAVHLIQDVRAMAARGGGACEVVYEHVYREFNKVADELANQAMDGQRSWMTSSEEGNHTVEMNLPPD